MFIGCLEDIYVVMTSVGFLLNIVVAAKYESSDRTSLDRPTLYRALRQVIQRHPALCMRVSSTEPSSAVGLSEIDLDEVVSWNEDQKEPIEAIFQQQMATPFDLGANKPLWRLLILRKHN